ncbi:MAG: hypothetical protein ACEY3J_03755 [Arsenophonus sp.]
MLSNSGNKSNQHLKTLLAIKKQFLDNL